MNGTEETLITKYITGAILAANGSIAIGGGGILTSAGLDDLVYLGITYGAWVKIFLFISLAIVIMLNVKKLFVEILAPLYKLLKESLNLKKKKVSKRKKKKEPED